MFERAMAYLRGRVLGRYMVASCGAPEEPGGRGAETAERMAGDLERACAQG